MGVIKTGAKSPLTPAPITALPYLCFFPADGGKIQATRYAGGRWLLTTIADR
ncbi:MAG: hypothetical protein PVI71_16900 [Desulfobacterales bacterium]